ncbi:ligase-associated DNA damage response endonuclease PdeM [Paracoccus aerodenitrificans]|uniref:ligase-associated DNA damage response endonuclease PdeM n=1 Tax=Paracoccus aerodenitrificans TaxID=3017781 RepID=UPI0022F09A6D|nr:ligase-associated DNA damage response endonuclease PdeM [Paracoccus aerodenitrificans]WBU64976.1 ligase-associated DNA damage response endonuclease PdeM [Paracoccus aerodenitrificans]
MTGYRFRFAGQDFVALGSGALYWPGQDMLLAADLHLGKSERMARRGGALLPPFETRETLSRLAAELDRTRPGRLALLGDIYDDDAATDALDPEDRAAFGRLTGMQETVLIAGNHDLASGAEELRIAGLTLRHIAGDGPDISGHFHPKAHLAGRSRACFLVGSDHLILPAFGAYTGGLRCDSEALAALVPQGLAILTGKTPVAMPVSNQLHAGR